MNSLFISPHNDDEALFGAYTLMREKPLVLVVTDGYIQGQRGDPITWQQRRQESLEATKVLGCPLMFGGIGDTELNQHNLEILLEKFSNFEVVYVPAQQGGNHQHDLIGFTAKQWFEQRGAKVIEYSTYTKTQLWVPVGTEVVPTEEEKALKNKALDAYQSQINLGATAPHFWAVRNKSEWLLQ